MGPKSIDCLRIVEVPATSHEWAQRYDDACQRWSEKAVVAKMESLARRGYLDYGVSARTGWLNDKGRAALLAVESEADQ